MMTAEQVGPNTMLVLKNGAVIGSISKAFGSFYARPVADRKAVKFATEREAAAFFGF